MARHIISGISRTTCINSKKQTFLFFQSPSALRNLLTNNILRHESKHIIAEGTQNASINNVKKCLTITFRTLNPVK